MTVASSFRFVPRRVLASAFILLAACSGDGTPAPPPTGTVIISSAVRTTSDNASFNYFITMDQDPPQTLGAGSPVRLVIPSVAAGTHTISVSGLAAGCTTAAGVPSESRAISVRSGDTVNVTFDITCVRTTGDIVVSTTTTGVNLDADGYALLVDGNPAGNVGINGSVTLRGLTAGTRSVQLTGVAPNCIVAGGPLRTANLAVGATGTIAYSVTCVPPTEVQLSVTTSGGEPDADGYLFFVDDGQPLRVAANGNVNIRGIAPGAHTFRLRDIADNCALTVAGTRQVTLGENIPVALAFTVVCLARGSGTVGFTAADAPGDTLPNSARNPAPSIDLVSMTGRYAPGWFTLTLRFRAPVVSQVPLVANSLHAFVQLDLDENSLTGTVPSVNSAGGNATQGVDATISTDADATSALLLRGNVSTGRVGVQYLGDSVVISVPLALLDNDDGNMTVTATIGTRDRPTDIAPNTGVILARRPAATALERTSAALRISRDRQR